jgi:Zn-dependent oligopeptidase
MQNEFFPRWNVIKAEHVKPGILHIIGELNAELTQLEQNVQPTWSCLVEPLERIVDRITRAWGTMSHLKSVKDTPELREAVEAVQGDRVKLSLRLSQSRPLYEAFQALKDGEHWEGLSAAQKRIVDNELRAFVLGGVALEGQVRGADAPLATPRHRAHSDARCSCPVLAACHNGVSSEFLVTRTCNTSCAARKESTPALAAAGEPAARVHNPPTIRPFPRAQAKGRFNEIAEALNALSTKFSNHVLDATKAYSKLLTTESEVAGLPESARALLAQQAASKGHEGATAEAGPWLVTLDIPAYLPIQVRTLSCSVGTSAV